MDAKETSKPGHALPNNESLVGSSVLEDAQALWSDLGKLAHDRFQLAALETQRAGESLVSMIIAGVMVALLLSIAWSGLLVAAVLSLVEHGLAEIGVGFADIPLTGGPEQAER